FLALALVFVSGLTGCGGDSDGTPTPNSTTPHASAAAPNLQRLLLQAGEEPGFRPGRAPHAQPKKVETITGLDAFVNEMGLPPADRRRLRSEWFISFPLGRIRGARSAGVTNVALYETAAGAKHSVDYD